MTTDRSARSDTWGYNYYAALWKKKKRRFLHVVAFFWLAAHCEFIQKVKNKGATGVVVLPKKICSTSLDTSAAAHNVVWVKNKQHDSNMTSTASDVNRDSLHSSSWMEALERGLRSVEEHAPSPVKSLRTIRTICANVADHPTEPRYRKIRLDNTSFRRKVWEVEGGREVCEALGWRFAPGDKSTVVLPHE